MRRSAATLQVFELWDNRVRQIKLDSLKNVGRLPRLPGPRVPVAGWPTRQPHGRALRAQRGATELPRPRRRLAGGLARHLAGVGRVTYNRFLLRLEVDRYVITVFPDGRTIIGGTDDIAEARTVHAKYIGA